MNVRLIAALAVAASTVATAPANAAVRTTGVDFCANESQDQVRGYCDMITTPGNYTLTLVSQARYAFARVWCTGTAYLLEVNLWNVDADYPVASDSGRLPGPQCILEVAAGEGGTAAATVRPAP